MQSSASNTYVLICFLYSGVSLWVSQPEQIPKALNHGDWFWEGCGSFCCSHSTETWASSKNTCETNERGVRKRDGVSSNTFCCRWDLMTVTETCSNRIICFSCVAECEWQCGHSTLSVLVRRNWRSCLKCWGCSTTLWFSTTSWMRYSRSSCWTTRWERVQNGSTTSPTSRAALGTGCVWVSQLTSRSGISSNTVEPPSWISGTTCSPGSATCCSWSKDRGKRRRGRFPSCTTASKN